MRDAHGNVAPFIAKDQVQIALDGVPQQIESLSVGEPQEMSLGLLLDWSGSRRDVLPEAELKPASQLIRSLADPHHFAFAAKFSEVIDSLGGFTNNPAEVERNIHGATILPPHGSTALYQAIIWACGRLTEGPGRKALIVFAEGDDNASRATPGDAIQAAQRANTAVYFVSVIEADSRMRGHIRHRVRRFVQEIAQTTGGEVFFVHNNVEAAAAFLRIGEDLRNTCIAMYSPQPPLRPGSFPLVRIRLADRALKLFAPQRYFVPRP